MRAGTRSGFVGQSRGQPFRLLVVPANLLLDATKLGLNLGSDRHRRDAIDQCGVDDAAHWMGDRNFETYGPAWVQASDQRLDHRCLESIHESRTGPCEEANAQVGAQGNPDRGQHLHAGCGNSILDAGEMRTVNADHSPEFRQREATIEPQAADLVSDVDVKATNTSVRLALYVSRRNRHVSIQPVRALLQLTCDATNSHQIWANDAMRLCRTVRRDYESRAGARGEVRSPRAGKDATDGRGQAGRRVASDPR